MRKLSVRLPSVCTSVRPSVKRVYCDKTPRFFIQYERTFILVFRQEEYLVGDDPFNLKFWAKLTPFEQKRSATVVTAKKVQLTL